MTYINNRSMAVAPYHLQRFEDRLYFGYIIGRIRQGVDIFRQSCELPEDCATKSKLRRRALALAAYNLVRLPKLLAAPNLA